MPLKKAPKNIASGPGVYYFKDAKGEILYIGKAKNLNKRIKSYFQKQLGVKNQKMVSKAEKIEYTQVETELESIILEANLIKEHQPKYNIIMKDDKNFVYIKINLNEDYPRIELVRKIEKDGAKYFGPKTAAHKVKKTLKLLKKLFPFRHCGLDIDFIEEGSGKHKVKVSRKVIKYPCIDYYIKRCAAPCIGLVTPKQYREILEPVLKFLEGDTGAIKKSLDEQMKKAAAEKQFEKAAQLRDKLLMIAEISERQIISGTGHEHLDVIEGVSEDKKAFVTLLQIRDGKLINQENFTLENQSEDGSEISEVLGSFIRDYYQETSDYPKEILISQTLEDADLLENFLEELSQRKIKINSAKKGKKHKLLELAGKNAESFLKQQKTSWEEKEEKSLNELKDLLKLDKAPKRIEGYDISHLGGTDTVGSMVVFKNGLPDSSRYRHFRIKKLAEGEIDDFLSLKEVFSRRLLYIKKQLEEEKNRKEFKTRKLIKKYKKQLEIDPAEDESCFLLLKKEKVGGYALLKTKDDYCEISRLQIDEKLKGRNLEKLLIEKCIDECKQKKLYTESGKPEIFLEYGWKELKNEDNAKRQKLVYEKKKKAKSSFGEIPDLILVDGGKGQLSQLLKILKEYKLEIPAISLAKREEEIFVPGQAHPIILPETSRALKLLQRIRNEAHRFAIEHQRKTRKSKIQSTALDELTGIGPKTRNKLLKKFKTIENIKNAGEEELKELVSSKVIEQIRGIH